jgi:hypothetical protein
MFFLLNAVLGGRVEEAILLNSIFFCSLAGNMASILEVDDNMGHTFIQVLSLYKGSMPL